jgi:hypothetical protein
VKTTPITQLARLLLAPLALLTACGSDIAPEVHLIPAQYQGPLVVLYSQPGYPPLPRLSDSLLFDFRPGNVLRTSSPLVTGSVAFEAVQYYYVEKGGRRRRIRKVDDWPALRQQPPSEPCLLVTAGRVSDNMTSEFLTSARNFDYNSARSNHLFDSLATQDIVSAPLIGPPAVRKK